MGDLVIALVIAILFGGGRGANGAAWNGETTREIGSATRRHRNGLGGSVHGCVDGHVGRNGSAMRTTLI